MSILVLDFGSQLTQLIARRLRELGVHSEVHPWQTQAGLHKENFAGIVLSGSHASVSDEQAPKILDHYLEWGLPVLGICYGMQVLCHQLTGTVANTAASKEFGTHTVRVVDPACPLFAGLVGKSEFPALMSHGDSVVEVPEGFKVAAVSNECSSAAVWNPERHFYCVQFHPEVTETTYGSDILGAFLFEICKAQKTWTTENIIDATIAQVRREADETGGEILLALSGGVDSTVTACLLHRAVGSRLKCVLVDHGLLRKEEAKQVHHAIRQSQPELQFEVLECHEKFMAALRGVTDPEQKRKIIGSKFIEVFDEYAHKHAPNVTMLAQGTIYPDVIESAGTGAALIKSHHNVGGLPEKLNLRLIEPLKRLFKDEVRKVGIALGLPQHFIGRHPSPGPGLAVRIIGEVDAESCAKLREADDIFVEELRQANLYSNVSQAFAVLVRAKSVCVRGDKRAYEEVITLRCVTTIDFMTAVSSEIPLPLLKRICQRICNEVAGVSRVVYDLTDKPPATIEWE